MNTRDLKEMIEQSASMQEALEYVQSHGDLRPLRDLLTEKMQALQMSPQQLAKEIDVERSTLYRLLSGERLTSRNVLLRIALAMRMTQDETQTLLRVGQRAELYPRIRRDAVILFSIFKGFTLEETEKALEKLSEASLFDRL